MKIIRMIIGFIVGVAVLIILVGVVRTWQVQRGTAEQQFLAGKIPTELPDGLYKGSVPGLSSLSWQGKKFNRASQTGINVFKRDGVDTEVYPFATRVDKGLRDIDLDVIKIDYNIAGNPWWLRTILDEIVEVAPGRFMGKLHVRLIPGYPFALGYFFLEK